MAKALNPEERWRYILKTDLNLPPEEQTVFLLKALSRKEMAVVRTAIENDQIIMAYHAALERGLVGWENFRDADGNIVEFKTGADGKPDVEANLNRLDLGPDGYGDELAAAIIRRQRPGEGQVKNSGSPATSSPASSPTENAQPAETASS